jgi:hypothetical protein
VFKESTIYVNWCTADINIKSVHQVLTRTFTYCVDTIIVTLRCIPSYIDQFLTMMKSKILSRIFLVLLVLQCKECIGRPLIPSTRLMNSPLGIGIRSAVESSPQYKYSTFARRRQTPPVSGSSSDSDIKNCATPTALDDRTSRNAAISREDAKILGIALTPKLIQRRRAQEYDDELEYLEKTVLPCGSTTTTTTTTTTRGGDAAVLVPTRPLVFWESMVSGAISRSIAQTIMHPANCMKTIMQSSRGGPTFRELAQPKMFKMLTRGAGANFILSVPHGAVNFAVLEFVRQQMGKAVDQVAFLRERKDSIGPGLDFVSSAISTICCSVVSTPQMMVTDNIMAGNYQNLGAAVTGLYQQRGIIGFYAGWWPGIVGKIPSYVSEWLRLRTYTL